MGLVKWSFEMEELSVGCGLGVCSELSSKKGQWETLIVDQFLAGYCQFPRGPFRHPVPVTFNPDAQHPWFQQCSLILSQTLAHGPGADPLRCSKAVASLALCPSGCLEV